MLAASRGAGGDYNVVLGLDIYDRARGERRLAGSPRTRDCYNVCSAQGWSMPYGHVSGTKGSTPSGILSPALAKEIRHADRSLLLNAPLKARMVDAGVDTWARGEPGAETTLHLGAPGGRQ